MRKTPRSTMIACLALALAVSPGCQDKSKDDGPSTEDPPGDRPEGPGAEGDDEGPGFPPPGAQKAPPPPAVSRLMSAMVNAYNAKDTAMVHGYFMKREAFLAASDCDPADVVDRVMDGAEQSAERAAREGGAVTFKGFGDGYLLEVKVGDKPAECRARIAVTLYMAKYQWEIAGRVEDGEAHFLRLNDVWFFVKL